MSLFRRVLMLSISEAALALRLPMEVEIQKYPVAGLLTL
jgi:hypothetical protein